MKENMLEIYCRGAEAQEAASSTLHDAGLSRSQYGISSEQNRGTDGLKIWLGVLLQMCFKSHLTYCALTASPL